MEIINKEYINILKSKNKYTVYKYTNKINKKIYIGSCIDMFGRYKYHLTRTDSDLEKDIKKYGIDNFKFEILATFKEREYYQDFEKKIIREYKDRGFLLYSELPTS